MLLLAVGALWQLNRGEHPVTEQSHAPTTSSPPSTSSDRDRIRCSLPTAGLDALSPQGESLFLSIVTSAENSTLRWEQQAGYIEYNVEGNDDENRGYTGGIVGFTSKTHDMLLLVRRYDAAVPNNPLSPYIGALTAVDGTSSTQGLGPGFVRAWKGAARDDRFLQTQLELTRQLYLRPAVDLAKRDKLGLLGQFVYADAAVMHGLDDSRGLGRIRRDALADTKSPASGGDEKGYLAAFLDARVAEMRREKGHMETSRVDTGQRAFLEAGNLGLTLPLQWKTYGDRFSIVSTDECARRGISQ